MPPEQFSLTFEPPQPRIFRVSDLTGALRGWLNRDYADIRVAGEISGCKTAASGHCYFTVKDQEAQLRCVIYRSALRMLKFKPQDGLAVVLRGSLDLWDARGELQFIVSSLQPQGFGALQLAFEQLKKKLESEGLFAQARKRPLPRFPARIGIVTSATGAAVRDLIHVLHRRSPGTHIRLFPTLVQGEGAAEGITQGLEYFSRTEWADLVIVGRGGGSLEDLWAFNEERVARAIASSRIPVISAVGHETDFTISDFVADLRAPTPSAAAEMAVPETSEVMKRIQSLLDRNIRASRFALHLAARKLQERGAERGAALLHRRISRALQRVDDAENRQRQALREVLERARRRAAELDRKLAQCDPRLRLARNRERWQGLDQRLALAMNRRLGIAAQRLDWSASRLDPLSPLRVLARGYALVENEQGAVVRRPEDAPSASRIRVRLAEGQLQARVE